MRINFWQLTKDTGLIVVLAFLSDLIYTSAFNGTDADFGNLLQVIAICSGGIAAGWQFSRDFGPPDTARNIVACKQFFYYMLVLATTVSGIFALYHVVHDWNFLQHLTNDISLPIVVAVFIVAPLFNFAKLLPAAMIGSWIYRRAQRDGL
jgi:hypothetical protein